MTRTCQERRSNVLTKPVRLCRQEQLIREEHSVSGHMCTRGPVSQHTTGKRGRGTRAGRRLTSSSANNGAAMEACCGLSAPSPWHALLTLCLQWRGGVETAGFNRPLHNLSSLQDWTHSVCVCTIPLKLLLSALIGLSLMSKQTATAAK